MIRSALMHFINDKKEEYKKNNPLLKKQELISKLTKIYWDMPETEKRKYKDLEKIKL